jgi:hypothetical protein
MTFVGLLVFAVLLLAPVVVALGLRRLARDPALRAGAVFAGSATLLYVGIFVVGVFGVQSSTAALGFLVLPFTEAIVFALTLVVGWGGAYLIRRGAHRRALLVPPAVVAVVGGALVIVLLTQFLVLDHHMGSPKSDPEILRKTHSAFLAREGLHGVLAGFLAMDANRLPLARLAVNPSAPEDVLIALATHPNGSVVWRAFRNPNLQVEALRRIAIEHPELRTHLASSPNAPPELLRELAEESGSTPNLSLAIHPNLPEDLREALFDHVVRGGNKYLRNSAATQPEIPPYLLRELAEDEWHLVRYTVAANRKTPLDLLETLAHDPHADVRAMGKRMLEVRTRMQVSAE